MLKNESHSGILGVLAKSSFFVFLDPLFEWDSSNNFKSIEDKSYTNIEILNKHFPVTVGTMCEK